jgi:catechol 2,3-dioxygenase-like lactoylglutathione lyase family enzyme
MNKILGDKFLGIQHIGIPVTDIIKSERFYYTLGFDCVMRASFPHNRKQGQVIMMQRGDVIMELYQLPEPERSEIKKRKDGHIDHITFGVTDINATFSELKEAGFNIVEEEPVFLVFWENGCKYFNVLGPDNERLEFNEIITGR